MCMHFTISTRMFSNDILPPPMFRSIPQLPSVADILYGRACEMFRYCLDGSFKTANLRDDPQMSLSILKTRGDRGRSAYGARPPLEFYVVTIIFLGDSGNMTLCTSHGNVKLVSKK